MSKRPIFNVTILSAALLLGVGSYVVRAAGRQPDQAPEAARVANVDMQRVFEDSDARAAAEDRIQEFGAKISQRFDDITKLPYLTPDEVSDLSAAMNAEKPTDAQTKRIADLRQLSAARAAEFQTLSAKKDAELTAQDRARMNELSGMQQQRQAVQERLQQVYSQAMDHQAQQEMRTGMAEVRGIVGKLAKEQGYTQVYDTSALVYATNDLTDAALKRVQTKKKDNK